MARFVNAHVPELVQPFWDALQRREFIADAAVERLRRRLTAQERLLVRLLGRRRLPPCSGRGGRPTERAVGRLLCRRAC